MTTELERIKILEGKISQVVEYINTLSTENEKLKQQVKELRTDKTKVDEQAKKLVKLDEEIKKYEDEREIIKGKIEAIINQNDQLGI